MSARLLQACFIMRRHVKDLLNITKDSLTRKTFYFGFILAVFICMYVSDVLQNFHRRSDEDIQHGSQQTRPYSHSDKDVKHGNKRIYHHSHSSEADEKDDEYDREIKAYKSNFVFMYGSTAVKVEAILPTDCTTLFIGINSAPNHVDTRNMIRKNYLTLKPKGVSHAFILGNPTDVLRSENNKYKDIIFINQTERYVAADSILPYKVAAIMQVSSRMDPQPKWMLKTDDDSFVNLPKVLKKLKSFKADYFGMAFDKPEVIREKGHKWYASKKDWASDYYPPYCAGAGYFLTRKAYLCASTIFTKNSTRYYPREDVQTGVFMKACNIKPTNLEGVAHHGTRFIERSFLIVHYVTSKKLFNKYWRILQSQQ